MFDKFFPPHLPMPDPLARQHSEQFIQALQAEIVATGALPFARYMQQALYHPTFGYYSAGSSKFGQGGDFVTAPELSPLFAQCLAKQCAEVLAALPQGNILEFGAGTGALAAGLLEALAALNCLPQQYWILEVSADLTQRQQALLQQRVPQYFDRVVWLKTLPTTPFIGVVLANEVLDAMPVSRVRWHNGDITESQVVWQQDQLGEQYRPVSTPLLQEQAQAICQQYLPGAMDYCSEINLMVTPWLASISAFLQQGVILLIDYGFARAEYYHPQRQQGTLMCHYRHRAHSDPFILPGLQDITAHVDFTLVAEAAQLCGLAVAGYTTQAGFLLSCGLTALAQAQFAQADLTAQLKLSQQIQLLTMPHEMGELFKVMALTRGWPAPLLGFQLMDKRERL